MPTSVIPLKGLYINQIKQEKSSEFYGLVISHENKQVRSRVLYHRTQETILDWINHLKLQANNLNFEDKYNKGRKLGNGKFSTVY